MATLLNAVTTDATSAAVDVTGPFTVQISGLKQGASVLLTGSTDAGTTYSPMHDGTYLRDGIYNVTVYGATKVKATTFNVASTASTVTAFTNQ